MKAAQAAPRKVNTKVKELGEFIRTQRSGAEMSLRKLAKLAGVSNPYLSQVERGLRHPSAEIIQAGDGLALTPLFRLVAEKAARPGGADLTLFKSLGVGIADLALAEEILRLARERNVGTPLPEPAPVPLSFAAL